MQKFSQVEVTCSGSQTTKHSWVVGERKSNGMSLLFQFTARTIGQTAEQETGRQAAHQASRYNLAGDYFILRPKWRICIKFYFLWPALGDFFDSLVLLRFLCLRLCPAIILADFHSHFVYFVARKWFPAAAAIEIQYLCEGANKIPPALGVGVKLKALDPGLALTNVGTTSISTSTSQNITHQSPTQ